MSDDEVLSQGQVESLLQAMEAQRTAAPMVNPTGSSGGPSGTPAWKPPGKKAPAPPVRALPYDFKRPERVGKEQMRAIRSLHEGFARSFAASISTMLRMMIEVRLSEVTQKTYSEFIYSLDNPSCFSIVKPEPLEGHWVLDIAPTLSFAFIDRMLGGDPVPGELARRPLTEIENRLIQRVIQMFLEHLSTAWNNITAIDFNIDRIESNPQLVAIVPPNEVVILVAFEVRLGRTRGLVHVCIPFNSVERFNSQLSSNGWAGYSRNRATPETRDSVVRSVDAAPVEVVVTLARSKIKTGDLMGLNVGDIITTEQEVSQPLEIAIQNVPKLQGAPGSFKGKKAIRIVVPPPSQS